MMCHIAIVPITLRLAAMMITCCHWQVKNVSGRLLVGLRWWNEVTDEGSNWRFESLTEVWGC